MYIQPTIEKKYELSFKVNTQLGFGHLRRNLFNDNTVVEVDAQGQQVIRLEQNDTVTFGPVALLQVLTDVPLVFTGTKDDDSSVTLEVRQLLLLDQPFKSWVLTNPGENKATVKIVWGVKS